MFKKGLLILTLCLSTIGLSGCGKSAKDGVEFVNGLDAEVQEISPSQAFIDWVEANGEENTNNDEKSYILNIKNNTKYYFNNMPIGVIVDDQQLTLDDLQENEYEIQDANLILAPGDTYTMILDDANADSKITLVPDYNGKYQKNRVKEDLTADSNIEELDSKFFDKYVTKEGSDKMLYPSDVTVGKASYKKAPEESDVSIAGLEVEITNNTDKDVNMSEMSDSLPFFLFIVNDNECEGAAFFFGTGDSEFFVLPPNESATAKFLYMGPENVDNVNIIFNGLALE